MALSPVARARGAATELRACLEEAATADERERIAAIIAELVGTPTSIADMAAAALADTFGTTPGEVTSSVAKPGVVPPTSTR